MPIKRTPKDQRAALEITPPASKPENIIGIDPDVDRSGVAWLHPSTKELECHALPFPELLDYLQHAKKYGQDHNESLVVVVEAGWMNAKSCYHAARGKGAERIAKNVGANHQVGKEIIRMCVHWGITVIAQGPLHKVWAGKDGKITHKELTAFASISNKLRTTQDMRDACLLAWDYAGLPIVITNLRTKKDIVKAQKDFVLDFRDSINNIKMQLSLKNQDNR